MTRTLQAATADEFPRALREALSGAGPAVFAGEDPGDLPATVGQRVALVVQSSGSTAHPKRVALSADALLANAAATDSALGGPGQWLLGLPTTYIAGIAVLVRSFAAQTEPAVIEGRFTAASFVRAAERLDHPLRFASLVPAQLDTLLAAEEALPALRRFDRVLLGGQATPPALLERAAAAGVRVTRTYGSSETAGGCVYDGTPVGGTRMRIVDGLIELSGPTLAEGYLGDPERTEAAFHDEDGARWYRTGDLGRIDDGVLTVLGRSDDVIVSGGIKVPLGELESFLRQRTVAVDAVVVPVDDPHWGQVPVVATAAAVDLAALRSTVAAELGAAAAPARVLRVDALPLLPSGKPDRRALREAAQHPDR